MRITLLPPPVRLLNRDEALRYCGLPRAAEIPVTPKRVRDGKQGLRYDVRDLDRWIDNLDSADGPDLSDEAILARLDGDAEGQRSRR